MMQLSLSFITARYFLHSNITLFLLDITHKTQNFVKNFDFSYNFINLLKIIVIKTDQIFVSANPYAIVGTESLLHWKVQKHWFSFIVPSAKGWLTKTTKLFFKSSVSQALYIPFQETEKLTLYSIGWNGINRKTLYLKANTYNGKKTWHTPIAIQNKYLTNTSKEIESSRFNISVDAKPITNTGNNSILQAINNSAFDVAKYGENPIIFDSNNHSTPRLMESKPSQSKLFTIEIKKIENDISILKFGSIKDITEEIVKFKKNKTNN